MKSLKKRLFRNDPNNFEKFALSEFISQEIHLTSWNLTSSFLLAKQN
jgi:hypothetical protein